MTTKMTLRLLSIKSLLCGLLIVKRFDICGKKAKQNQKARFYLQIPSDFASYKTMAILSEGAKQRLSIVIDIAKTAFHYGFIPTVLYLG